VVSAERTLFVSVGIVDLHPDFEFVGTDQLLPKE
jgi:hypothetical protein